MSIRVSLYDFFAYTLPGVFYLLIVGFWLNAFRIVVLDASTLSNASLSLLNNASLFLLLVFIGAGYIVGLLVDPIAYRWLRLFRSRNRDVAKSVFDDFRNQHKWLEVKFNPTDWGILLFAIKTKSTEVAMDIEQHNVASIMLRNISLGFLLISIGCLVFFFVVSNNAWNLVFALLSLAASSMSITRSSLRRSWFYAAVFEAFSAHYLMEGKLSGENLVGMRSVAQLEPPEPNVQPPTPKPEIQSMKIDDHKKSTQH